MGKQKEVFRNMRTIILESRTIFIIICCTSGVHELKQTTLVVYRKVPPALVSQLCRNTIEIPPQLYFHVNSGC